MTNGFKNNRLILDKRLILAKYNTITNLVDQKDRGLWERDCTITKTQESFKHAHNHFLSNSNSRGHLFCRC